MIMQWYIFKYRFYIGLHFLYLHTTYTSNLMDLLVCKHIENIIVSQIKMIYKIIRYKIIKYNIHYEQYFSNIPILFNNNLFKVHIYSI